MAYQKSTIEHPKVPRSGRLYIIYPKGESKNTKECAAVACFSLSPPIPEFLCFSRYFSVCRNFMVRVVGGGLDRCAAEVQQGAQVKKHACAAKACFLASMRLLRFA